jgi:hypothetical protein
MGPSRFLCAKVMFDRNFGGPVRLDSGAGVLHVARGSPSLRLECFAWGLVPWEFDSCLKASFIIAFSQTRNCFVVD